MGRSARYHAQTISAIVIAMRGLVRRLLIGLLALSFAASGVVARQCDAAHHAVAPAAAQPMAAGPMIAGDEHHDHSADHGEHAHHANAAMVHQHALDNAADSSGPMTDDHMCAKCCGLCTLVISVAPDARIAVIFTVSPASFSDRPEHRAGATVKVDPGIPIIIV